MAIESSIASRSWMNRNHWNAKLVAEEKRLGLDEGFKFVYTPWASLKGLDTAFLSLNPGARRVVPADMRRISDERGNYFEVEQHTSKSLLTEQFLLLAKFIGRAPGQILTGVVVPFRSRNWAGLSKDQRQAALELGECFWRAPLSEPSLRLIFACSSEAARTVTKLTDAVLDQELLAGWGNVKIRRYVTPRQQVIIHLPHLSRFRLLGRQESERQLRLAIKGA